MRKLTKKQLAARDRFNEAVKVALEKRAVWSKAFTAHQTALAELEAADAKAEELSRKLTIIMLSAIRQLDK